MRHITQAVRHIPSFFNGRTVCRHFKTDGLSHKIRRLAAVLKKMVQNLPYVTPAPSITGGEAEAVICAVANVWIADSHHFYGRATNLSDYPQDFMISSTETFGHFFLETKQELLGFFLRRLNCPDTAADLAQETYLRLHLCEQKAPTQNRRALAFSIAGNLVVDHVRKERVRSRHVQSREGPVLALESIPSLKPNSEQSAILREDLDQVQEALAELPEESQAALYLSAVEGLTYAQIGECQGVSERMVAKRIAKTLKHCRMRCRES